MTIEFLHPTGGGELVRLHGDPQFVLRVLREVDGARRALAYQ